MRGQLLKSSALSGTLIALLGAGACQREEPADPATVLQSQSTQPTNHPVTTVGCLMAGETANSYVLMAARTEGSAESRNYHLVAGPGMDFQEHVGERVKVSGTVELREASQTQTLATPAETEGRGRGEPPAGSSKPTGTAGDTPMVQTSTDVAVDRLTVESVSSTGEKCSL